MQSVPSLCLSCRDMTLRSRKRARSQLIPPTQNEKPCSSHKSGLNVVQTKSTSSLSAPLRSTSGSSVAALDKTTQSGSSDAILLLITSINAVSTMTSAAYDRVCLRKNHRTIQNTVNTEDGHQSFIALAISTLNSCQYARIVLLTDQIKEPFK